LRKNVSLKKYTTFRIGGRAKYFFMAKSEKDLFEVIRWAVRSETPFFILGRGSNLLVSDKGYKGIVIKIKFSAFKFKRNKAFVSAGTEARKLVQASMEKGLSGLEWLSGIPTTIGGAIRGNAGAFGKNISNVVKKVKVLEVSKKGKLRIKNLSKRRCRFSYKQSIFKKNENLIILSAVLKLKKDKKENIKERIEKYLRYRKENHPNGLSAGCIFKNYKFKGKLTPASFLIEKAGLKGEKIGSAQVSPKHANFIINLGKAKAEDVFLLIKTVKKKVKDKFGISLEEEIQYLGDF